MQERPGQHQPEYQDAYGGEKQHGDDRIDEDRLLDHDHRAWSYAVDEERRDQHRGGRRAGDGEGQRGDERARHDRVVAGFGCGKAVDRALAEFFRGLARAARRGIGGPGADVLADAGNDPDKGADYRPNAVR